MIDRMICPNLEAEFEAKVTQAFEAADKICDDLNKTRLYNGQLSFALSIAKVGVSGTRNKTFGDFPETKLYVTDILRGRVVLEKDSQKVPLDTKQKTPPGIVVVNEHVIGVDGAREMNTLIAAGIACRIGLANYDQTEKLVHELVTPGIFTRYTTYESILTGFEDS